MSFDTPAGTRGIKPPPTPVMRWMNKLMAGRAAKSGKAMGMHSLSLTTIGAQTGAKRVAPVAYFSRQDGSWLIVASAGGSARNPAWYHNMAAHPDQVTIELGSGEVPVVAEQLHGAQRDEAWQQVITEAPRFDGYQKKTDRELPVIRLVARA